MTSPSQESQQGAATYSAFRTLALTSFGHLVNDGAATFVPIVATLLLSESGVSVLLVTLMSTAYYSATTLASPFVGSWADRRTDLGRVMAFGLSMVALALAGFYAAVGMPPGSVQDGAVLASAVVSGMGTAFYHPLAGTIIQRGFRYGNKGRILGLNGLFGALGVVIYPPVFLAIGVALSTTGMFSALVIVGLVSALTVGAGLRGPLSTGPGREAKGPKPRMRDALNGPIIMLTVINVIRSTASGGLTFWLPKYIATFKGTGVGEVLGLSLGFAYVASIPGQAILGYLSDRFDKRAIVGMGAAGTAIVTVGYVYTSGLVSLGFLAFFGFFTFSNFPTLVGLAMDYSKDSMYSTAIAISWGMGTTIGSIIGPAVVGLLIGGGTGALPFAFDVMAAISVAGALATPLMPRPKRLSTRRAKMEA